MIFDHLPSLSKLRYLCHKIIDPSQWDPRVIYEWPLGRKERGLQSTPWRNTKPWFIQTIWNFFVLIWPFNCEIVHYCANVVLKLMIPRLEISFHNIFIVNTMMDWKVSDHRQTYFISMQMKYVWPWQLKNVQKGLKNR